MFNKIKKKKTMKICPENLIKVLIDVSIYLSYKLILWKYRKMI